MMRTQEVLRHFKHPTKATKQTVNKLLAMPDEVILEMLIQKNRLQLTEQDRKLLTDAQQEATKRIIRGRHHLVCHILGESGQVHRGLQETYARDAEIETCAEVGAINNLAMAEDKPRTAVTIHYLPIPERDGEGVTSILPPCLRCAGRFRHLYLRHKHDFGVIVYHSHEIIKVSAKIVHLFQYPQGYNGDGSSKF